MTNIEKKEILERFNEKFKKLERSSYVKYVVDNLKTGFSVEFDCKERIQKIQYNMPNEENFDAFILTIRFFIQDNEKISIRNIARIYSELNIPQKYKDEFNKIRDWFNTYKNEVNQQIKIGIGGKQYTRGEIFDLLIYGYFSHENENKRIIVKKIMENQIIFAFVINDFFITLYNCFCTVGRITDINKKVLKII